MAGWFSKVEKWWAGLSGLRQFLVGGAVTYFCGLVGDFLLARFGAAVSWWPVVTGLHYLREYFLNGYVFAALASGLVVGFWPYIAAGFKATAPLFRALLPLGLLAAAFFVVPELIDWWGARNDPRLFEPTPKMVAAAAKMKLEFVKKEPAELARLYKANTSVKATALVKPYIGEIMPITGTIYDIDAPTDNVNLTVKLSGTQTGALLNFEDKNRGPIWALKKGQRIRAACWLVTVDDSSVGLNGCKLVP